MLRRCFDEGLDAARDRDLFGDLVRAGAWVRARVRVRVRVRFRVRVRVRVMVTGCSATSSLSERLRSAPATCDSTRLESVWFSAARMRTSSPSMSAIECLLSSLTDRLRIAPAVATCTSPAQV